MTKDIKKPFRKRFLGTTVLASAAIFMAVSPHALAQGGDEAEQFIEEFLEQTGSESEAQPNPQDQGQAASPAEASVEGDVMTPLPTENAVPADTAEVADDVALDSFIPEDLTQDIAPPPETEAFSIPEVPAVPVVAGEDEGLFYDSESLVPQGQIATGTIRKVSPRTEPGSRYVVVTKKHSAGSKQAKLVSAQRALKLGRYDSALEIYNDLYAQNRRDQAVLMGRAVALQKAGRTDAAVQAYEELLEVDPDNVEAKVNMLGVVGRRYPAVALRRLLDLKKDNPTSIPVLAQLAVIEGNVGRYEEALKYLGIASGLEPRNAGHLYNMAIIADRAGDKKMAVDYYEQSLEADSIYGGSRSVPREAIFARLSQIR